MAGLTKKIEFTVVGVAKRIEFAMLGVAKKTKEFTVVGVTRNITESAGYMVVNDKRVDHWNDLIEGGSKSALLPPVLYTRNLKTASSSTTGPSASLIGVWACAVLCAGWGNSARSYRMASGYHLASRSGCSVNHLIVPTVG